MRSPTLERRVQHLDWLMYSASSTKLVWVYQLMKLGADPGGFVGFRWTPSETRNFWLKKALTMAMLYCKLSLIVTVAKETLYQSIKVPYPTRERGRPHKQIFETPVYRLPSGPSAVLSLLSIQRGHLTILSVGLPVSWGLISFSQRTSQAMRQYLFSTSCKSVHINRAEAAINAKTIGLILDLCNWMQL